MNTNRSAELERRRRLAVQRVYEGHPQVQVAQILGVHETTVNHWVAQYRQYGDAGLAAKPRPGRPPKLPRTRQNLVLGWLRKNPRSFGFATELWTARRIAQVIERKFGVQYNHRYICAWLASKNFSPQKPETQPRERDQSVIDHWLEHELPRIQNECGG